MRRFYIRVVLMSLSALTLSPSISRAAKPAEVLAARHLKATDAAYILGEETEVLDGMKSLRQSKKQVDEDKRLRKQYDAKITTSKAFITQSRKEYSGLQDRLTVIHDVAVHNRMVTRMNMLVLKSKEAAETQKEAEDKENEMSVDPETRYVDGLLTLGAKADAVGEAYQALASDAAVKSAIAQSTPKLALGPSKEFADAAADLKKWRDEVESEAIPLTEKDGVNSVVALVNGEQHSLILDPGSSLVTITGEMADALKITVTDQDPVIQLKLADGNVIQGKRISLKNVRVGRFSVDNVPCVVLAKGLHDAPALLGNSFLSHFVVKIDQKAGQLHLVDVGKGDAPAAKSSASPGDAEHSAAGKIEEK